MGTMVVACGLGSSSERKYHRQITQLIHKVTAISDLNACVCLRSSSFARDAGPAGVGRCSGRAVGNNMPLISFAPSGCTRVLPRCDIGC
jgi:hypothetical protein